jgi:hypothetical protein
MEHRQLAQSEAWTLMATYDDQYGLCLDGETGDFRVELWKRNDGKKMHVAVSREFGFDDVFEGWPGQVSQVKGMYLV